MKWAKRETPKIPLLGKLEAHNVPTLYLNQVFGQYIMHFNIGLGVLLILVVYLTGLVKFPDSFQSTANVQPFNIAAGVLVSVSNLYLALGPFRRFSLDAQASYESVINPKSAVVFDLDNTLVDTARVFAESHRPIIERLREKRRALSEDDVDKKIWQFDRELTQKNGPLYDKKLLIDEVFKHFAVQVESPETQGLADSLDSAFKQIPALKEGSMNMLSSLKGEGWNLFLITEGQEERVLGILNTYQISSLFKSVQVVSEKNEENYRDVMKEVVSLKCDVKVCVGDSIRKEITFGNRVGFITVWISSKWEAGSPSFGGGEAWPNYTCANLSEVKRVLREIREKARSN